MKKILLPLSALSLAMALGSCSTANDMANATNQPTSTASPSTSPSVTTVLPGTTNGTDGMNGMDGMEGGNGADSVLPGATIIPESTGVTSMDKARRVIEQIEEELERLSEVEDAEVVIAGNRAAVGLEFDAQYQGGIDDRLRKMVQERINSVISGISSVAITADEAIVDAIESLGERLETMSDMNALESDLDAIIKKIGGTGA